MDIAVIGLGKIGLPLASHYAKKGHRVVGVDINPDVVALVNEGVEPFPGEANLASYLSETVSNGSLRATDDYSDAIPTADAVVVVVPLFVDSEGNPDFEWMDNATRSIGEHLSSNTLVSYETTLPVGTCRTRWTPMLEKISGLREGQDFHVVFSPERVLTGRVFEDLRKYPKLVGGLSPTGETRGVEFYEAVLDFDNRDDLAQPNGVWPMGSAEAAEMVKLAETTYRDVNIGLANQFARFADSVDLDVYKVIEASNSQPYSHIHQPGIAVGGHCIPVYPKLYLWTDPEASIVAAAREANLAMPGYAVSMLEAELGTLEDQAVGVLGASYRAGVKETAFSGVFDVVREIQTGGGRAYVEDPLYTADELIGLGLSPLDPSTSLDAIVVQTNHSAYRDLGQSDFPSVRVVIDGRNIIDVSAWDKVVRIGQPNTSTIPPLHP